jgi:hypothetical protein
MFNEILSGSKESTRLVGDDQDSVKIQFSEPMNIVSEDEIADYQGGVSFEEYVFSCCTRSD